MKNYDDCRNCGYPEGLHHYETMQCPKGGEAPEGRRQEWLKTTYLPNTGAENEVIKYIILHLEERIIKLEKKIETMEARK